MPESFGGDPRFGVGLELFSGSRALRFYPCPLAPPQSKLPLWLQSAIAGALRSAITLPLVAGLGPSTNIAHAGGALFARLPFNRRHVRRATANLEVAFPEWSKEKREEVAVASYQHLAQLAVELAFTPRLVNHDGWSRHIALGPVHAGYHKVLAGGPCILVTGHCGNWELVGYAVSMLGFPMQAVYRPLDLKPLDAWVRESREKRGLLLVSKFGAVRQLPEGMKRGVPAGLVADQNGGDYGLFVPFFGRLTSTYKSIGLLALQFNATILCGIARRLEPGEPTPRDNFFAQTVDEERDAADSTSGRMRYVMEMTDAFGPEDWEGTPDPLFYITARYRRSIEMMVRQSPRQYLWMHRIWRSRPVHERKDREFPSNIRAKLEALPWMTHGDLNAIVHRSDLDRALIREKADHGFRV